MFFSNKSIISAILLLVLITMLGCDDNKTTSSSTDDLQITALIPLTGQLGGYGTQLEYMLELALEDANESLENSKANIRLNLQVIDTNTDPETARIQFENAVLNGCKYFIGPLTSGEIDEISESTLITEAIIISPSSTSQEYAVPGDHIYRLVPSDSLMVKALAEVIEYEGKTTLVTMSREDNWGLSVSEIFKDVFPNTGGNVAGSYQYFTYRRSTYQYILEEVAGVLNSLTESSESIAIQMSSFEEGNEVLAVAKEMETEYPILGEVQWYGSDGIVQNEYLLTQSAACEFATQTQFLCPIFGFESGENYDDVLTRFNETISVEPWTYTMITYDALMLMANILGEISDPENIESFITTLPDVANEYPGITGAISFDSNGDRAGGIFDFYRVVKNGENYMWEKAVRNDNGTITTF